MSPDRPSHHQPQERNRGSIVARSVAAAGVLVGAHFGLFDTNQAAAQGGHNEQHCRIELRDQGFSQPYIDLHCKLWDPAPTARPTVTVTPASRYLPQPTVMSQAAVSSQYRTSDSKSEDADETDLKIKGASVAFAAVAIAIVVSITGPEDKKGK